MCEYCEESGVISVEEYEADEGDFCEFIEDDFEPDSEDDTPFQCPNPPSHCVVDTMVEEHLCEFHATSDENEEAYAFAESIGLGSAQVFPIKSGASERCEYIDLFNGASGCQKPATHARVLEVESFLCDGHLREYLEASDDKRKES